MLELTVFVFAAFFIPKPPQPQPHPFLFLPYNALTPTTHSHSLRDPGKRPVCKWEWIGIFAMSHYQGTPGTRVYPSSACKEC